MSFSAGNIEECFRRYVLRCLLPKLGIKENRCRVCIPVSGVKNIVRMVESLDSEKEPEQRGAVVRIYPVREEKKLKRMVEIKRFLIKHGVPVPEIVDVCTYCRNDGVVFYAERLIKGQTGLEMACGSFEAERMAETLFLLHSITFAPSDMHFNFDVHTYRTMILKRVKNRLTGLKKYSPEPPDKSTFDMISDFFHRKAKKLNDISSLQLVHDKLHPGNLIFSDNEGIFYLLDTETVQPGCCVKDLMHLYHETLKEDSALITSFERIYFDSRLPLDEEIIRKLTPFYDAYYHLAECAISWKRYFNNQTLIKRSKGEAPVGTFMEKARRHQEELFSLVE